MHGSQRMSDVPKATLQLLSPTDPTWHEVPLTAPPPRSPAPACTFLCLYFMALLKRAHLTMVHKPTYQEYMWGFIIPGQQDIPSQHVSFQTVAAVKVGGITTFTTMFHMVRLVFQSSARSDQL